MHMPMFTGIVATIISLFLPVLEIPLLHPSFHFKIYMYKLADKHSGEKVCSEPVMHDGGFFDLLIPRFLVPPGGGR